jgi:hypothetical protein
MALRRRRQTDVSALPDIRGDGCRARRRQPRSLTGRLIGRRCLIVRRHEPEHRLRSQRQHRLASATSRCFGRCRTRRPARPNVCQSAWAQCRSQTRRAHRTEDRGVSRREPSGAGRAGARRKSGPQAPKSPWGDEVGPHGPHRQIAGGRLFRPAEGVRGAKWPNPPSVSEFPNGIAPGPDEELPHVVRSSLMCRAFTGVTPAIGGSSVNASGAW